MKVTVIIPAYNECSAIASVLGDIDKNVVHDIIVADNGSTDNTAEIAKACGARVVWVPEPGYGNACLGGLGALKEADIVVFLDGDFADYPGKIFELIKPIVEGRADFVIGSRPLGGVEKGALTLVQRYGNWLATKLIQLFYGHPYTDLGPFRAIRRDSLISLNMRDKKFGWTVEMQIKAVQHGLKICEIPVPYRNRIGKSKISGTIKGIILASSTILFHIFTAWFLYSQKRSK